MEESLMAKKLLALVLSVLMLVSLLPVSALAETDYVAYIGNTGYATLALAIEAADPVGSTTIYLTGNDTQSFGAGEHTEKQITINKNLTIVSDETAPKGGYSIIGNPWRDEGDWWDRPTSEIGFLISGGNVTFKNVTLKEFGADYTQEKDKFYPIHQTGGTLTLENVTINRYNNVALLSDAGTLVMTDCTITGDANGWSPAHAHVQQGVQVLGTAYAEIKNTSITGVRYDMPDGVDEEFYFASGIMVGGEATATAAAKITNCTIEPNTSGSTGVPKHGAAAVYNSGNGLVTISGGSYTADVTKAAEDAGIKQAAIMLKNKNTVSIEGGTFSTDPTACVGTGYVAVKTNGQSLYEVLPADATYTRYWISTADNMVRVGDNTGILTVNPAEIAGLKSVTPAMAASLANALRSETVDLWLEDVTAVKLAAVYEATGDAVFAVNPVLAAYKSDKLMAVSETFAATNTEVDEAWTYRLTVPYVAENGTKLDWTLTSDIGAGTATGTTTVYNNEADVDLPHFSTLTLTPAEEPSTKIAVTFDSNGGTPAEAQATELNVGDKVLNPDKYELSIPTRDGYELAAWTTTQDDVTTAWSGDTVLDADYVATGLTLFAFWRPLQQDLTVTAGEGGTVAVTVNGEAAVATDGVYKVYTDAEVVVTATPDAEHLFEQIAYTVGSDTGTVTESTYTFNMPAKAVTASASFTLIPPEPTIYTVTVDVVGEGTVTLSGEAVLSDGNPFEEGYIVTVDAEPATGWQLAYINLNDAELTGTTFEVTGNATLTVVFTEIQYNIKWVANNDTDAYELDADVAYAEEVTVPDPAELGFSYAGHEFMAWLYGGKTYAPGDSIVGSELEVENGATLEFVAQWDALPTFNLTVNYDRGLSETEDVVNLGFFVAGVNVDLSEMNIDGNTVTAKVHPSDGYKYVFDGWDVNHSLISGDYFTMPDTTTVVTAHWRETKEVYTVTYYKTESDTEETYSVKSAEAFSQHNLLGAPAADEGKVFAGWKDDADGSVYQPNTPITVSSDMVFRGTWNDAPEGEYEVTVTEVEGGKLIADPTKGDEGDWIALTAEAEPGYTFNNDFAVTADNSHASVTVYETNKFQMPAENVTVTGSFNHDEYTATVELAEGSAEGTVTLTCGENSADDELAGLFYGDTVTVAVDAGTNMLLSLTATYVTADDTTYTLFDDTSVTSFTMPAANVTVTAKFGLGVAVNTTTNKPYATLKEAVDEALDGETVKLVADSTEDNPITVNGRKVTIDLQDNTYTSTAARAFQVGYKSAADLVITGTTGEIKATDATKAGSVVYIYGGSLTLEGGTLNGCQQKTTGVVYVTKDSTFEMTGGKITGGNAPSSVGGAGVYVLAGGTFKMSGGEISGNKTTGNGGGVYLNSVDETQKANFTMSGDAYITGNDAALGAGIYVEKTTKITFEGNAGLKVIGNNSDNVYLVSGATIDAAGLEGAEVGVTVGTTTGLGPVTSDDADPENFKSDRSDLTPVNVNEYVELVKAYDLTANITNGSAVFTLVGDETEEPITQAINGAQVKVTLTGDEGYVLDETTFSDDTAPAYTLDWDVDGLTATFKVYEGNVEVTATFKPLSYTVEFDPNIPDNAKESYVLTPDAIDALEIAVDEPYTLKGDVQFALVGYAFQGWDKDGDGVVDYAAGEDVEILNWATAEEEITLKAIWKANTYFVSFDKGAKGEGAAMATQGFTYDVEQALSKNTYTAPAGYSFKGWAYADEPDTVVFADEEPVKNLTATNGETIALVAVITADPQTVTVNYNKGHWGDYTTTYDVQYDTDAVINLQADPWFAEAEYAGRELTGWKINGTGDEYQTTITVPAGGFELVAQWSIGTTYTVDYLPGDGATGDPDQITVESGSTVTLPAENKFTAPAGKYFGGWESQAGGTYDALASVSVNDNMVFTATWVDDPRVIVKECEFGTYTISPDASEITVGTSITLTITPNNGYSVENVIAQSDAGNPTVERAGNKFTFNMPAGNVYVTVSFEAATGLHITVADTENGTIELNKEEAATGDTIYVTLKPDDGYYVVDGDVTVSYLDYDNLPVDYSAALEGEGNNRTFIMPGGNTTVGAKFTPYVYTIETDVKPDDAGAIEVAGAAKTDEEVSIAVSANPGYMIESISYVGENSSYSGSWSITPAAEKTVTIDEMPPTNITVTATFYAIDYDITIEDETETVTAMVEEYKVETANVGNTVKLAIAPSEYVLEKLTYAYGTSGDIDITEDQEFIMPADDVIVTATFAHAVAKIGDVYYTTLDAAFAGAENGDTITVLENTKLGTAQQISNVVALDLNGHDVTVYETVADTAFAVQANGTFTIANGYITGNDAITIVDIASKGEFTLTDAELSGGKVGVKVAAATNAVFSVSGKVVVSGNTESNVFLAGNDAKIAIVEALTEGSSIGVTHVNGTGVITSGENGDDYYTCFTSDNTEYSVRAKDNAAVLSSQITITIEPTDGGKVTSIPEAYAVQNDTVTVNYEADTGYMLTSLTVTVDGQTNPMDGVEKTEGSDEYSGSYTFTITASVTIKAIFEPVVYKVEVDENIENGTVTPSVKKATYLYVVTVDVEPAEGYKLVEGSLKYNEYEIDADTYSFEMPAEDVVITAKFEPATYTIYEVQEDVTAVVGTAKMGDEITVTAEAPEGKAIKEIVVTAGSVGGEIVRVTAYYNDDDTFQKAVFTMPASDVWVDVVCTTIDNVTDVEGMLVRAAAYETERDYVGAVIPNGSTVDYYVQSILNEDGAAAAADLEQYLNALALIDDPKADLIVFEKTPYTYDDAKGWIDADGNTLADAIADEIGALEADTSFEIAINGVSVAFTAHPQNYLLSADAPMIGEDQIAIVGTPAASDEQDVLDLIAKFNAAGTYSSAYSIRDDCCMNFTLYKNNQPVVWPEAEPVLAAEVKLGMPVSPSTPSSNLMVAMLHKGDLKMIDEATNEADLVTFMTKWFCTYGIVEPEKVEIVTEPATGITFAASPDAWRSVPYTFTVTVTEGYSLVNVKANGDILTDYTVDGDVYTYTFKPEASKVTLTAEVAIPVVYVRNWSTDTDDYTISVDVKGTNFTTLTKNTFDPEGPAYSFAGWNTDPDGKGQPYEPNTTYQIADLGIGTKLYAQWVAATKVQVTFDDALAPWFAQYVTFNGVSYADGYFVLADVIDVTAKIPNGKMPTMARTDYTFDNWYLDEECKDYRYDKTKTLAENGVESFWDDTDDPNVKAVTLYAKWTPQNATESFTITSTNLEKAPAALYYSNYLTAQHDKTGANVYRRFVLVNAQSGTVVNPTELPAGLYLNELTGEIYGVPTAEPGEYLFTVRLQNDDNDWISPKQDVTIEITKLTLGMDYVGGAKGKIFGELDDPSDFYSNKLKDITLKATENGANLIGLLGSTTSVYATTSDTDQTLTLKFTYNVPEVTFDIENPMTAADPNNDPTFAPVEHTFTVGTKRTAGEDADTYKVYLTASDVVPADAFAQYYNDAEPVANFASTEVLDGYKFVIEPKDIATAYSVEIDTTVPYVYTGYAITPDVVATDNIKVDLATGEPKDNTIELEDYATATDTKCLYEVVATNNVNAGTATATIYGRENYTGSVERTFTIEKKSLADADVYATAADVPYTGSLVQPADGTVKVTYNGKELKLGDTDGDYKIYNAQTGSPTNGENINVSGNGKDDATGNWITIEATANSNFVGQKKVLFNILPVELRATWTPANGSTRPFDGTDDAPKVTELRNNEVVVPIADVKGISYTYYDVDGDALSGAPVNVGKYKVLATLGDKNYIIKADDNPASYEITKIAATITWADEVNDEDDYAVYKDTWLYMYGTTPGVKATITGLAPADEGKVGTRYYAVNGDAVTAWNAGKYTAEVYITDGDVDNYDITGKTTQTIYVIPAIITITPDDIAVNPGDSYNLTYTVEGYIVEGDTLKDVALATEPANPTVPGDYPIKVTAYTILPDASNYVVILEEGTLTIGHVHAWTYTANGAVITAKCSGCNATTTLTLVKPEKTSESSSASAEATFTLASDEYSGNAFKDVKKADIKYYVQNTDTPLANAPTAKGDYTAKITVDSATASVDYSISGGGSGPVIPTGGGTGGGSGLTMTLLDTVNGTINFQGKEVAVREKSISNGDVVKLEVKPAANYQIDKVTYTFAPKYDTSLDATLVSEGLYQIVVQNASIKVTATFKPINDNDPSVGRLTISNYTNGYKTCPKDFSCLLTKFTDLDPTAWYHDGIHYCLENGIMQGFGTPEFLPFQETTRAQVVTTLWNIAGHPIATSGVVFTDVNYGDWFYDAIMWAAANGIVDGYGDGTFGPNDLITHEQIAKIFYGYAVFYGFDVSAYTDIRNLPGADKVSAWAIPYVSWAVGAGLCCGKDGDLSVIAAPENATRAELATTLLNFCTKVAIKPAAKQ
jgi:hypothetical protein